MGQKFLEIQKKKFWNSRKMASVFKTQQIYHLT